MIKKLIMPLVLCASIAPARAGFTDGLVVGGFAGLATGLIASAASRCPEPYIVYEQPYYVEYIDTPCCRAYTREEARREAELVEQQRMADRKAAQLHYEHVQLEKAKREQEKREQAQYERERRLARRARRNRKAGKVVEKTVIETRTDAQQNDQELKKRELALKERELELALIKEKKELLATENRKKELELKERKRKAA